MRLIVVADTHLHSTANLESFMIVTSPTDYIVHAGDFVSTDVLNWFSQRPNFVGVAGNNDSTEIKLQLPGETILDLAGFRIGVCHGHGTRKDTAARAYAAFADEGVDVIIFGHSHQPMIYTKNKILMINPGSLTAKRRERWPSYAVLEVSEKQVSAHLEFILPST